ncbi:hypothetical protein ACWDM8_30620 [Streptomyces rubiginosohelvolus]
MLRRAVAAAVALAAALVPAAHADDGRSGGICKGATMFVKVCASEGGSSPAVGGSGAAATPAGTGSGASEPACTYTRLDPQPPPENA